MQQQLIITRTLLASISLTCEFLTTVLRILSRDFRTTFVRVSRECREHFLVSRTSRELVAKFFNMLKIFMRIFSPKYFARLSRDIRATVARRSCECRELVAAKFWRIYNAKFSRHSYEYRASVARPSRDSLAKTSRLSCEKIKLSDIRTYVARHSHECRATVVRIQMKISYIRGKVVRHSHECHATVVRQSRDSRAIYFQN